MPSAREVKYIENYQARIVRRFLLIKKYKKEIAELRKWIRNLQERP